MNKTISIITLLLVSLISFNTSAQNTNIIGTWKGKTSGASDNPNDSMKGVINYDYTLNTDYSGEVIFYGNVEGDVNEDFYIKLRIKGSCPFTWTKKDNIITFTTKSFKININLTDKDLDIICSDPKIQSTIDSYKSIMVKMMRRKFKSSLKSNVSSNSQWEIIKSDENTLTIKENDNTIKLTRVK